jgi:hypothetical protein
VSGPGEEQRRESPEPAAPDPPAWPAAGSLVGRQLRVPAWMRDWTMAMRAAQAPG